MYCGKRDQYSKLPKDELYRLLLSALSALSRLIRFNIWRVTFEILLEKLNIKNFGNNNS